MSLSDHHPHRHQQWSGIVLMVAVLLILPTFLRFEVLPRSSFPFALPTPATTTTPAAATYNSSSDMFFISGSRTTTSAPIFVSFIVPTKMRETLHRTALSFQNQTRQDDWEALFGIDVHTMERTQFPRQFEDDRFSFLLLATETTNRGAGLNGAGALRNKMIHSGAARGEWVAFVDDDDTVSPYYVEWLQHLVKHYDQSSRARVDLVLFRMKNLREFRNDTILPPFRHVGRAHNSWVGISFAVRRDLFSSHRLAFVSHDSAEDYKFLKEAYEGGFNLQVASCVAYFVRASPEVDQSGSCNLTTLTVL